MQLSCIYSGEVKFEDLPEEEKSKTEIYAIDDQGKPFSPSWYSLNLKVNLNVSENLSLSSGIDNITDQLYRPYSSGIAGSGRNFFYHFMPDYKMKLKIEKLVFSSFSII